MSLHHILRIVTPENGNSVKLYRDILTSSFFKVKWVHSRNAAIHVDMGGEHYHRTCHRRCTMEVRLMLPLLCEDVLCRALRDELATRFHSIGRQLADYVTIFSKVHIFSKAPYGVHLQIICVQLVDLIFKGKHLKVFVTKFIKSGKLVYGDTKPKNIFC